MKKQRMIPSPVVTTFGFLTLLIGLGELGVVPYSLPAFIFITATIALGFTEIYIGLIRSPQPANAPHSSQHETGC